jgi:pimeloyl-ACP methyl ester carboxylesterase
MADESAPISMARVPALLYSLTEADSTRKAGGSRPRPLASEGFRIIAIDFRGFGCSTGPGQSNFDTAPFANDVLAAVRYMKTNGAGTVSVVGGSFGGAAAGDASINSAPGEIERIVFLGAAPNLPAEKLKSRSLFIVAREDRNDSGPRLPGIRAQYEMAPQPKERAYPLTAVPQRPKAPRRQKIYGTAEAATEKLAIGQQRRTSSAEAQSIFNRPLRPD